jgi:hypothetical protein
MTSPSHSTNSGTVKIPNPKEAEEEATEKTQRKPEMALPQTLVRIPTEHAPMLQAASSAGAGAGAGGGGTTGDS